jgi:hypothetical protein
LAISLVQAVRSHNSNTLTVSSTGTGNLLVVLIALAPTTTASSVTDNAGNTYVQASGAFGTDTFGGGSSSSDIWYAKNSVSGATTITVTSTASFTNICLAEFSGADTSSPLTSTAKLDNQVAPPVGPSLTGSLTGQLYVALEYEPASNGISGVSSPWTALANPFVVSHDFGPAYLIADAGTYQATYTPTTNAAFSSSGAIFSQPSSPKKRSSMFLVF